jgi:hypothetical protein
MGVEDDVTASTSHQNAALGAFVTFFKCNPEDQECRLCSSEKGSTYLSNNFITWQSAEVLKYDKILIKKSHDSFLYREVHPTYHPCGMLTAVYSKGNICEGTDLERLHTICYKSFILRQNQKNLLGLIPICLNP